MDDRMYTESFVEDSREQLREAILADVEAKAPFYTPEWRYHRVQPDAGTALAFIWADMLSGTRERCQQLPDNYRRGLINAVGLEPRPALPSKGYLSFVLAQDATEGTVVPRGTAIASADVDEAVLVTQRDLYLSPARICAAICTDGASDTASVLESPVNIRLFAEGEPCAHRWIFAHPYAFDMAAGETLRLRLDTGNTGIEGLCSEAVLWEYLEAELWRPFMASRLDKGDILVSYPLDKADSCTKIRFSVTDAQAFEGMALRGLSVFPAGAGLVPDAVYCGDDQQVGNGLYPFGRQYYPYATVQFACNEALSKPGALVELSFALKTEEFAIEGYPDPPIVKKPIMRREEFEPPPSYEITISEVVWEYFNGTGWAVLPVEGEAANSLFTAPSPSARTQRVRFVCPDDMASALCGAHDLPFIRARVVNIENFGRTKGHYLTPHIERVRFRYHYDAGVAMREAAVDEYGQIRTVVLGGGDARGSLGGGDARGSLGGGDTRGSLGAAGMVEGQQDAQSLVGRIPEQPTLYLGFDQTVEDGSLLFEMERPLLTPSTSAPVPTAHAASSALLWEYYDGSRWTALDVHDGTEGMTKTGLLTFHAPRSLAPTCVMGVEACFIRVMNTVRGSFSAQGEGPLIGQVWTNVVPALARDPGVASNLAALSYRNLATPIGRVSAVHNPLPTYGGSPAEDDEGFARRLTARFNNHDRAITGSDFEELAQAASQLVLRCRCFPHTSASGAYAYGQRSIVVLTRGEHGGDFRLLAQQIKEYVSRRESLAFSGSLHVVAPRFAEVHVSARLLIANREDAFIIKRAAHVALDAFLDARCGGALGEGFSIGSLPTPELIAAALKRVEGVERTAGIDVWYLCDTVHGPTRRDYAHASTDPFVLPKSGSYTIELEAMQHQDLGAWVQRSVS